MVYGTYGGSWDESNCLQAIAMYGGGMVGTVYYVLQMAVDGSQPPIKISLQKRF